VTKKQVSWSIALLSLLLLPLLEAVADDATFSVDVNVVNVLATVRDSSGGIVSDLEKEDFRLKHNGRDLDIRYFARQSDLPLTIGLLVDTSASQIRLIEEERRASSQFFDQILRPEKDLAFVIKFDGEVELLEDLTGERSVLQRALLALHSPFSRRRFTQLTQQNWQWPGGGGGVSLPGGIPWPGGGGQRQPRGRGGQRGPGGAVFGTKMFDAVYLAADEMLQNQSGRKAIILISDGVDVGSMMELSDAIEASQRADTIIYSIRYYDKKAYTGGLRSIWGGGGREKEGMRALDQMSEETGGRSFDVAGDEDLAAIFDVIQEELRHQYNIGFSPDDVPSGYQKIKLSTVDNSLKVRAREGYYLTKGWRKQATEAR
jgi:VWFA-related protein